jgi:uncharacterized protein with FMN-binding domain/succinate dehydrogenase/fumarate reductase flavoprotein subunit
MESKELSRRSFIQSAGMGCAVLGGMGVLSGCAPSQTGGRAGAGTEATYTFADTIPWNAIYDVVVIGFGGAGAMASIYAADAGANVLLIDAAPEGDEGGNTRYAAQMTSGGLDPDDLLAYYKYLNWHLEVDEEVLKTYTDGLYKIKDIWNYIGIEDPFQWVEGTRLTTVYPEYPEAPGAKTMAGWTQYEMWFDGTLWRAMRRAVMARLDRISVWLESPARHLIQDPQTGTVIGVEIEKGGETVYARALNGVVLSCGGFENNPEMVKDYLGAARYAPYGTLYNKGDGIRMSIEVGADLWHMEAMESLGILAGHSWAVPEGGRGQLERNLAGSTISITSNEYGSGSIIFVGDDGSRFLDEARMTRHGHAYSCGVWRIPIANYSPHIIFDATQYKVLQAAGFLTPEREAKLLSADTPEALAELIGANPDILKKSIEDFNFFASIGTDYTCGRSAASMRAFDGGTLYAAEMVPAFLNTQGGPRRNASAQILDTLGKPIPHLYGAGELGGICSFQYNSGGNLAECMIFGRIAGTNAAENKEPLPNMVIPSKANPNITFSIGEGDYKNEVDTSGITVGPGEYLGISENGQHGTVIVKVTIQSDVISAVEVVSDKETPSIGGKALTAIPDAIVAANSVDVDTIAGATITSQAILEAVTDALAQVG